MTEIELATRWRRLSAALIDFILVMIAVAVVLGTTRLLESAEPWVDDAVFNLRVFLGGALAYLILNGALLVLRGQTIAKFMLGMKIVKSGTDDRAPIWALIVRSLFIPPVFVAIMFNDLGSYIFWAALVCYCPIFYKHRKCLYDYVLKTDVIRLQRTDTSASQKATTQSAG